jgi:hypothetical protein
MYPAVGPFPFPLENSSMVSAQEKEAIDDVTGHATLFGWAVLSVCPLLRSSHRQAGHARGRVQVYHMGLEREAVQPRKIKDGPRSLFII